MALDPAMQSATDALFPCKLLLFALRIGAMVALHQNHKSCIVCRHNSCMDATRVWMQLVYGCNSCMDAEQDVCLGGVGIDICTLVELNFGSKPFKFDLDLNSSSDTWHQDQFEQALSNAHKLRQFSGNSERTPMEGVAGALHNLQQCMEQYIGQQEQVSQSLPAGLLSSDSVTLF